MQGHWLHNSVLRLPAFWCISPSARLRPAGLRCLSVSDRENANRAPQAPIRPPLRTRLKASQMLHCLPFFSAGFSLAGPASHVKLHSAPAPLSRSSIPFAAAAAADDVDEVELRFRDLEVTKERAPEVLALMEEHSFPLGLAQRAIES